MYICIVNYLYLSYLTDYFCWACPWHFASVLVSNLSYFLCDAFYLFRHIELVTCKIAIGQYLMCNLLRKYWVIYLRSGVSFWFQLHLILQSHLYSPCFWDLLFVYEITNWNFQLYLISFVEGNGNLLQYSCLENPMDRRTWRATIYGVASVRHNLVTKPYKFRIASKRWELFLLHDNSHLNPQLYMLKERCC